MSSSVQGQNVGCGSTFGTAPFGLARITWTAPSTQRCAAEICGALRFGIYAISISRALPLCILIANRARIASGTRRAVLIRGRVISGIIRSQP